MSTTSAFAVHASILQVQAQRVVLVPQGAEHGGPVRFAWQMRPGAQCLLARNLWGLRIKACR